MGTAVGVTVDQGFPPRLDAGRYYAAWRAFMTIAYRTGDLFTAQSGILAHACNVYGVWGGGIAAAFKEKFPLAYREYAQHCRNHTTPQLLGTCYLIDAKPYKIACLFTNDGNTLNEVAEYTGHAVRDLARQLPPNTVVKMPQINAGIFGVPWEITEKELRHTNVPIEVYKLS